MRLSRQATIRRSTCLIAALPFRRPEEISGRRLVPGWLREPDILGRTATLYLARVASILGLLALSLVAAALLTHASSPIAVQDASYAAGVLEVRGTTARPQLGVSLDNRYLTRSDGEGRFHFRVHYLPNDCTIRLSSGVASRLAFVAGCLTR
jgi:hypothetical protein